VAHKVAYVPGGAFYVNPTDGHNAMRLNFSNAQPHMIEEGIRRLGELLEAKITANRPLAVALV
jgi:2-aminoadipate transaminase